MRTRGELKPEEISEMLYLFKNGSTIGDIKNKFKYDYRTIKKYLGDLYKKVTIKDEDVIRVYSITGCLKRSAEILGVSSTTIWRRLVKNNTPIGKIVTQKRLYRTLRARVTRSTWREKILERDDYKCVKCKTPSTIVHHIKKLSDLRDSVIAEYPQIDPFYDRRSLILFLNLVMGKHEIDYGEVLCKMCHDNEHKNRN